MPLLLLSSELETFELSDAAVALSVTLSNWPCGLVKVLDGSCPPAPIPATRLQKIVEFLETIADLIKDAAPQSRVMLIQQGLHRHQASIIRSQIMLQRICGRDAAEMYKGWTRYVDVDSAWDVLSATDMTLNGKGGNSILDAAQLLADLRWLHCPLGVSLLAEHIAKEMKITVEQPRPSDWSEVKRSMPASSEDVDKLRHLLGARDDLSEEEKAAAAAESLLTSEAEHNRGHCWEEQRKLPFSEQAAPTLQRSVSFVMDAGIADELNIRECLIRCDARTLQALKQVSAGWARRARELLSNPDSAWRQDPIWCMSLPGMHYIHMLKHRYLIMTALRNLAQRDMEMDLYYHADQIMQAASAGLVPSADGNLPIVFLPDAVEDEDEDLPADAPVPPDSMREILPQWSGWEQQPDLCSAALAVLVKLGPLMLRKPPNQISEWLRCVFRCAAHVSVTDDDDPDGPADDPLPLAPEVMHFAG